MAGQNGPLISVVIPTFDSADIIGRALDSVERQTCAPVEIIVVDDCSDDGTAEIVESRGGEHVRVVRHAVNQGAAAARNSGVAAASGEFIAFLDSDDEFLPSKLVLQMNLLERRPDAGMAICDGRRVDGNGKLLSTVYDGAPPAAPDIWKPLLQESFVQTSCVLIRKQAFVDAGGWPAPTKCSSAYERV